MRKRPAEAEQRGFHGRVGVEYSSLIFQMRIGLARHQKSCSGDDAVGAGIQCRSGVCGGGDSAREEDGQMTGDRARLWQEVECRHSPDQMTAGLSPLGDQTVSAPTDCLSCLNFGPHHHEDEDSGIAKSLDNLAIAAERDHRNVDSLINAHRDVATTSEVHQQIHRDGAPGGLRANMIDRGPQLTGTC
jgi:hypothetical protein